MKIIIYFELSKILLRVAKTHYMNLLRAKLKKTRHLALQR